MQVFASSGLLTVIVWSFMEYGTVRNLSQSRVAVQLMADGKPNVVQCII